MKMPKGRGNGFTLTELLVVIAIISVLAGLIFPVFKKAKQRAHLTQDVIQMKQIYVAVCLYEDDSDDHSPPSLVNTLPYVKAKEVYVSDADPFRGGIPGKKDFPANISSYGDEARASFRISYAYLYPIAHHLGLEDAWFYDMRTNHPEHGLISLFMYNDPFWQNWPSEFDVWRQKTVNYRIAMDGSFKTVHGDLGITDGCSLDFCFGPFAIFNSAMVKAARGPNVQQLPRRVVLRSQVR